MKKDKKYVAIDNGHFSGKFPFVSSIAFNQDVLKRGADERGDYITEVTEREYAYIMTIDNDIEVLFNENEINENENRFFC